MAKTIYDRPKTPSSSGIPILHNSNNCGIFSIWRSPMFTLISPGYTSIVGRLKITPHFSYTALHSSSIKGCSPITKRYNLIIALANSSAFSLLSLCSPWSDSHAGGVLSGLFPAGYVCSSTLVSRVVAEVQY